MAAHRRCSVYDVKCHATVQYLEFHNHQDLVQ